MMMARPMRMIPPWRFRRSAARLPGTTDLYGASTSCGLISPTPGNFMHSGRAFLNTEICVNARIVYCEKKFWRPCREILSIHALKASVQLSLHGAELRQCPCYQKPFVESR
jgi:hypothetical protein